MSFELSESTVEPFEGFTVAGVAERGTTVDATDLWASLADYADDLDDVVVADERYGVVFEFDDDDEFTYLAGVAVDSTDDLPPDLTAVEIPEATYAAFSLRGIDLDEVVREIDEGLLSDTEYEGADGPVFQRYDLGEDPAEPGAAFELFVPVADDEYDDEYGDDEYVDDEYGDDDEYEDENAYE